MGQRTSLAQLATIVASIYNCEPDVARNLVEDVVGSEEPLTADGVMAALAAIQTLQPKEPNLLEAIEEATKDLALVTQARWELIMEAMNKTPKIPREDIAKAAGVTVNRLYQMKDKSKSV